MEFPIKHGGSFHSYVTVYQRVMRDASMNFGKNEENHSPWPPLWLTFRDPRRPISSPSVHRGRSTSRAAYEKNLHVTHLGQDGAKSQLFPNIYMGLWEILMDINPTINENIMRINRNSSLLWTLRPFGNDSWWLPTRIHRKSTISAVTLHWGRDNLSKTIFF